MFSMGLQTHKISVTDLFVANRQRLVSQLKDLSPEAAESFVFLRGGPSQERYDSDHEPIFRQVL